MPWGREIFTSHSSWKMLIIVGHCSCTPSYSKARLFSRILDRKPQFCVALIGYHHLYVVGLESSLDALQYPMYHQYIVV